jgi:hypothetical protein
MPTRSTVTTRDARSKAIITLVAGELELEAVIILSAMERPMLIAINTAREASKIE